jgi:hypothetical protein
MKVTTKETPKKFEPVEIQLTIENVEELRELWHRLNVAYGYIEQHSNKCVEHPNWQMRTHSHKFWRILNELCEQCGERK